MSPPFLPALRAAFERADGRPLAQAATVSPDGLPEVRTVVLRGLGPDGDPCFATDARSAKLASLRATPWLELCLFDGAAGLQWRLLGRAHVHAGDALARRVWEALPPPSRALFLTPPPGRPLAAAAPGPDPTPTGTADRAPAAGAAPRPPLAFAVVRLPPVRCDRLRLGPPLARRRWVLDGGAWQGEDVVP